jgi:hypothetical protein|tara:strand:- start:4161 stop:4631 length:471 start_codon:yes stop_codon:yes gene_type:complete|eukprot:31017-Pelagococcus_subviridis.AAC.12
MSYTIAAASIVAPNARANAPSTRSARGSDPSPPRCRPRQHARARSRSIDIRSDDRVSSVAARRNLAARARVAATVSPRVANVASSRGRRAAVVVRAAEDPKKPAILRENEKEAWLSKGEREGENPLKDPMAMFAIGGIMVPFIILAVAGAAGYIGN